MCGLRGPSVLPACAGVIPTCFVVERYRNGITRMRGGDPQAAGRVVTGPEYYPHARG